MINTNLYGVPKSNGDGGGKTTVIINGTGGTVNPFEPHYLWGQYFDDTQDINGDMTVNGSINADGNVTASSIQVNNANVTEKLESGQIEAADIDAANITADKAEITELSGDSLDFEFVNILSAFINELESNNIITKNLTVTGAAHFFELIIDKIKASGGAHLFTTADGFKIDKFEQISNGYRLYFKSTDGDKHIYNMWKTNDQAICRNFNQATSDINYDISNKYYWCLVTNTNADDENNGNPVDVNFGTQENPDIVSCHYIDISTEIYDGTVSPEIGDEIVMLGYRGNDDAQRQSAIYIAAYSSIDTDLIAPLICQYRGINDFNLNTHKYTWFAAGARNGYRANQITGNLILENGQTVNEYIDDSVEGKTVYSYNLMPLYQFVTISNNEATPQTIGCKILYNENNVITSLDTIPTGYKVEVYNNVDSRAIRTFTAGNNIAFNAPLKANDNITDISYLIIILIDPNNTTIDSKTISYVQSGAAGNDGADGGHYEFRYKNATSKPATPTSGQNTDNTWSDTPTDPDYSNNEYTWMTQCFVSGSGAYSVWSEPIRITGADGKDGEDGTNIEFIYKRFDTEQTFTSNNNNPSYWPASQSDEYYGPYGYTWNDNPVGINETNKFEYVAVRYYKLDSGTMKWSKFTTPVIWSKWGEKGQDGDGYEYIYRISDTEPGINYNAYNGKTRYDDGFEPKNWHTNPQTLDENNKLEWIAIRKKKNGVWGDFSTPKKWAHWSAPGTSGQDGGHWEFRYKNATEQPDTPTANQDTDNTWSETPSQPNYSNNEYTWMTQCFVSGSGTYGIWSEPIRITGADGKDGEDGVDGVDGKDGKNGTKIEFVYTRNNTGIAPSAPPTTQVDDWPNDGNTDHQTVNGVTWYDNPQGVSENMMYEFVSTRTCENDVWDDYSTPVIWAKWGEKGQDGDGYEYIYKRYTTQPTWSNNNNNPSYWPANTNDEYYGPSGYEWSDEPEGVTSTYLYEYCSVRKKTNGIWGKFSVPSLWAHWAPAGSNGGHYEFRYKNHIPTQANPAPAKPTTGTDGTANGWSRNPSAPNIANNEFTFMTFTYVSGEGQYNEWSDPIRITGDNGKDGEDGNSTEFIYARSTTSTPPAITYTEYNSKVPSDPDFVPEHWTDNPLGVNETEQYEFVSTRVQVNGQWTNNFSVPALWSKWGEKGQDGDGFEYIYILADDEPDNPTPANYQTNANYQNNDEYASFLANWEDEPLHLSEDNKLEWVSTRKKHDGVWGPFSDPKVWARWASKGSDGGHWEFRYQNAISKPTKPTTGQNASSPWTTTPSELSASDLSSGKVTWMTQCFVSGSGTYSIWSEPIRITGADGKNGEDGVDGVDGKDGKNGTKIEFVYTRNNTGIAPYAPPTTQVDDWPNDGNTDHQTVNGVTWYDNPQGVSENMMYEFVSTRTYENDVWGDYSTPVIWSKWGEKGQDGDGYEYIYCLTTTENNVPQLWQTYPSFTADKGSWQNTNKYANVEFNGSLSNSKILRWKGGTKDRNYSNTSTWHDVTEDGYLPPNAQLGHMTSASSGAPVSVWTDEPQGVSINYKAEWVAVRKKTNSTWGDFSSPKLWSVYATNGSDGPEGPEGPEGPSGADYEGYHLVDNGSSLIAAINSSYNPIRRTVITINFKVVHQVGANITPVTDLSGYYARYKLNNTSTWSTLSKNNTTGIISGNNDITWSDAHRYVTVELYKGTSASGTFLDSFTIVSVMEPKAIFDTSYGLYSLVQGHTAEINNISNRYTTLNQTVNGISTEVAQLDTSIDNLTGQVSGMSASISTIDQKADSITSMVSKLSGVQLLDQTAWINADETPADTDYKTYRVMIKGTKEVSSGSTLYYVFSSMTRLVSGNTYVFSLYPGTTSSSFQVDILYSSSLVKPRECSNIVTSITVATLDNDKYENNKRKTYKFTAPSTGYYTMKVKYNSSITFYCPQLENGDAATVFDASSMCMSSAIVQSADSISMKVSRCGIDINNYTINLNADTTNITGNLNLRRSDNGFTLYDTSNNPRINIKAQNIPTPTYGDSVFSSKGYAQSQSEMKTKVASGEVNAVTPKVSIGAFNYDNSIILTIYPEIYGIADNLWVRNNNSVIKCTAKLYRNTSTSSSYTSQEYTLQRTESDGSYTYPSFTWTVSNVTAGTYYIEVTIKATDVTNGYTQYYVSTYTEYTKEVTSLTYIGLDGLLVGATNNHFAKISKDGIELRWLGTTNNVYGGTSVKLDNNGLKRVYNFDVNSGPLSWVSFDGYTKATVLTSSDFTRTSFYYGNNYITEYNYIMKADDVIIFIDESLNNFSSTNNLYIRLGNGVGGTSSSLSLMGRHVCIRNFSDKTVYVCSGETSSGYCVLDRDDHDYADRWNIEHAFCTFMSIPTMIKNNYNINWCCAQRA